MKRKKPTKAQKWQRRRWNTKGHITSIKNRLNKINGSGILTAQEMILVKASVERLAHILYDWDKLNSASKRKYISMR